MLGLPKLRLVAAVIIFLACLPFAWQALAAPSAPGSEDHAATWVSVLPPVLAIGLALITRQVIVALVLGVWLGVALVEGDPATAFLRVGDRYLTGAVADASHASIILFSSILGGMVGVLSRSGATEGIVHWLSGTRSRTKYTQHEQANCRVKDLRDMRGVAYAMGASETPPEDALQLPSYEEVREDKGLFADATRLIHNETNPYNAKRLVQFHDRQAVVCNPPSFPISEAAMDRIYGLPYTRLPHPKYKEQYGPTK